MMRLDRLRNMLRPWCGPRPTVRECALYCAWAMGAAVATAFVDSARGQFDGSTFPNTYSGFRDYLSSPIGVQGGPILNVGNYGLALDDNTTDDDLEVNFFRLADDINGELIPAAGFILNPNGTITQFTDFGELYTFNVAFSQVGLEQRSAFRANEVGKVYWITEERASPANGDGKLASESEAGGPNRQNWWEPGTEDYATGQPTRPEVYGNLILPQFTRYRLGGRRKGVGLVYGFRQLGAWDQFEFLGLGGVLGRTYVATEAVNRVAGPQAGIVGVYTRGRWSAYAHGLVLAGYNDGLVEQDGTIGEEIIPGALNRPLFAQPTGFSRGETRHEFTPGGELWAEVGYRLTRTTTLKMAWRGLVLDNLLLTENRVRYYLPDFGLERPGQQELFVQHVFCGVEMVR